MMNAWGRSSCATGLAPLGAIAAFGLLLGLMNAGPVAAGVRAPLDGVGDFTFLCDIPTFPDGADRVRADLALRLDHADLRPTSGPDAWRVRVAVDWKLAREGIVALDTTQVFDVQGRGPEAEGTVAFDLLEIAAVVTPGRWAATVEARVLDDRGLSARATGVLLVPARGEGLFVSDPEFRIRTAAGSLPHPQRLYGVSQDTLEVYFEVASAPGERVGVDVAVIDPVYGDMDQQTLWIQTSGARTAQLYRLPLGALPAGAYVLRMTPHGGASEAVEADFVVSWRLDRAIQTADDVLTEAELVLPSDEIGAFRRLPRAVQSQRMQQFWDEHDPTPGTARNELYDRYLARVDYARRFYGEARTPGPLTDRGRVYVRYGEPSEVQVSVIPADGSDLDEAIERLHDAFFTPLEGVIARGEMNKSDLVGLRRPIRAESETQGSMLSDQRRNQQRTGQEGSFELWVYDGDGDPLLPEVVGWSENISLRFLFVDRRGTGAYELDFSNLTTRAE